MILQFSSQAKNMKTISDLIEEYKAEGVIKKYEDSLQSVLF